MADLTIRTFTAADHTRRAILQRVYAQYNFPKEAATLTINLHTAFELLLKERQGLTTEFVSAKTLIEQSEDLTDKEEQVVDNIREKRNIVLHQGRFPEDDDEKGEILEFLFSAFAILGKLWRNQNEIKNLGQIFTPYQVNILLGREPGWDQKSEYLAEAAGRYAWRDHISSVEISNRAFEVAARGFAEAWGVEDASGKPLRELIKVLEAHEFDLAHLSVYDDKSASGRLSKFFGDETSWWLDPPMDFDELVELFEESHSWSERRVALHYSREILDAVRSYPERVPYLEFKDCLYGNWKQIQNRLNNKYPQVEMPAIDASKWRNVYLIPGSKFRIPTSDGYPSAEMRPSDVLTSDQLDYFLKILEELCGPIPTDLDFE